MLSSYTGLNQQTIMHDSSTFSFDYIIKHNVNLLGIWHGFVFTLDTNDIDMKFWEIMSRDLYVSFSLN